MAKKIIDKPRNSGTMTESMFWSFIRSTLRKRSMYWLPIKECKQEARRPYKGTNKRQKWEYKCAICGKYFSDKEIEIDHIIPAGSLKSGKDLEQFVERLFCEKHGLRCLCNGCHHKVTQDQKGLVDL